MFEPPSSIRVRRPGQGLPGSRPRPQPVSPYFIASNFHGKNYAAKLTFSRSGPSPLHSPAHRIIVSRLLKIRLSFLGVPYV
jgi:hypothetical protein